MNNVNTTHPLRILHVVPSVDPAQGGVAESIRARGVKLLEMGHHVEVVSQDAPTDNAIANYPLTLHALGHGHTSWNYHPKLIPWLKQNSSRFDAVVVDGIWQYQCYAVRKALQGSNVPYFVFPHGMLDPWFKTTYPLKHLKKWLFWPWCEYLLLKHAKGVLFTCEEERRLAKESFWLYKANEHVVPFGTSPAPDNAAELGQKFFNRFPNTQGKRLVLFLGRLHPKKGVDLLIQAFAEVITNKPNLHLCIAGPGQPEYIAMLKNMAQALGVADHITWTGMLTGSEKWGALQACDVMALPSHQENFGIVVAEALSCGKPVIISNKVNIWREIQSASAGYVNEDTKAGTIISLEKWIADYNQTIVSKFEAPKIAYSHHFSILAMAKGLIQVVQEK